MKNIVKLSSEVVKRIVQASNEGKDVELLIDGDKVIGIRKSDPPKQALDEIFDSFISEFKKIVSKAK